MVAPECCNPEISLALLLNYPQMPHSSNEIKTRAIQFSKEWEDETSEKAVAKTFWDDFFNVFGTRRRKVGSFEPPAWRLDESNGYIDFL